MEAATFMFDFDLCPDLWVINRRAGRKRFPKNEKKVQVEQETKVKDNKGKRKRKMEVTGGITQYERHSHLNLGITILKFGRDHCLD